MRVAFGKIKITPPDFTALPLAGYTPIPKCDGVFDDIYARGVLLEDVALGNIKRRLLFISLDVLKIALTFTNYAKEQIQKAHSIPPGQVLMHATHTHKGPDVTGEFDSPGGGVTIVMNILAGKNKRDRYLVWMARQIVKLVGDLLQQLVPCKMAWARRQPPMAGYAHNRRGLPIPQPDIGVIAFRAADDSHLLGFLMHFAAHGISMNRNLTKISADWMGCAVEHVSALTNGEVTAAYFNGPSGDVSPGVPYWDIPPDADPATRMKFLRGNHGRKRAAGLGNAVAAESLNLAQSIPVEDFLPNLSFRVYTKTIWVPMKDFKYFSNLKVWFQNSMLHLAKRYLLVPIAMSHEEPNFAGVALKHGHHQVNIYTLLQWFRIIISSDDGSQSKELSILAAPGELFEEIGIRLRAKS